MAQFESDESVDIVVKKTLKVAKPSMYKAILLNDDYTTMDFVVSILQEVFNKDFREATKIMLSVHQVGRAVCGIYTLEIAEAKQMLVHKKAQLHDFPLRCVLEKV
jgi:ATP-dependent Clp protease adaptor protein ClpS